MRSLLSLSLLVSPVLSSVLWGPRFQEIFNVTGYDQSMAEGAFAVEAAGLAVTTQQHILRCEALLDSLWTEEEIIGELYFFIIDAIRRRRVFTSWNEMMGLMKGEVPRAHEYFMKSKIEVDKISSKLESETQSFLHLLRDQMETAFLALPSAVNKEIDIDEREKALFVVGSSYNKMVFSHSLLSPVAVSDLQRTFCYSSFVRIFVDMGSPNEELTIVYSLVEEASRFAVGVQQIQKALTK